MDQKDLCEHTRIRLIAAAIGHQQCTMTAASLVPLADGRVVAIGTPADVARLLPATTAAQPLDLDKPILTQAAFEEIAASWDGCRYDDAMIQDIGAALRHDFSRLALIAQARAARLDTTASASIDTPEFRRLAWEFHDLPSGTSFCNFAYEALVRHIDSRAAHPVQAGEAVALPAFSVSRFSDTKQQGVLIVFDHRLSDAELNTIRTTLAPVAAQQGAPAQPSAAPSEPALTPLDYRAQGREEALAIILAEDAENPFADYTNSYTVGDTGDYGTDWDEKALRELLHIGDRKHDAYDRAEAAYWDAMGHKDEAAQEMRLVERAPFYKPLHDFLSKHQAWDLMADLKRATAPTSDQQAAAKAPAAQGVEAPAGVTLRAFKGADTKEWHIGIQHPFGTSWVRMSDPRDIKLAELLAAAPATAIAATTSEDARDAARWRTALRFVGAVPAFTQQKFVLDTLPVDADANLLRGSVAEHFTKAIDSAMRATQQEGGK